MLDPQTEDLWGYAKRLRFLRDSICEAFAERRPLRILDVGCGNGSYVAIPLSNDIEFRLTGLDADQRSIEHARQLAGSRQNLQFVCGSLTDLPDNQLFDVIILSEVLEHLERPADLLSKAVQFLDRNGLLIVTVPNGYGEFEIDSWIFRLLRLQRVVDAFAKQRKVLGATDNTESGHVQFFTRARLDRLFRKIGLVTLREGAGSFLAGPIAGHFIARSARLIEWNARMTDRLPFIFASSWYFALRRQDADR